MNKTRENPATATSRTADKNKTRAIKAVNVITKATIATNMAFIFIFLDEKISKKSDFSLHLALLNSFINPFTYMLYYGFQTLDLQCFDCLLLTVAGGRG